MKGMVGLLLWLALLCAARAEFPIFERPDAASRWIGVARQCPEPDEAITRQTNYQIGGHLARRLTFLEIPTAPGKTGFVTPDLACTQEPDGTWHIQPQPARPLWPRIWGGACLLLAGGLWLGWRRRLLPDWTLAFIPAAVRGALTAWIVLQGGEVYLFSSDEPDFFRTMQELAEGNWHGAWNRTVGLPLLYWPFAAIINCNSVMDLLPAFSFFNGFLLGPGSVALLACVATGWLGSQKRGLITAWIYAVLPLFFFHLEDPASGIYRAFFALPDASWAFGYYKSLTWCGYNAMSDMPATVLLLGCAALLTCTRPIPRMAVLAGFLFGAAILVRINAILFAPYFLWQFHTRHPKSWRLCLTAGGIALLLTVAGQLILNTVQFGAPWITPFSLHDRASEGFVWSMLPINIPALFGANLPWVAAGMSALLLLQHRELRLMLGLWLLPTLLFFCGYPFTAEHTTRFILPLYGAWIAAAVGLWPTQWSRRNARTLFCWVLTAGATWFLQAVWFVFFLALSAAARIPADLVVTLRQKKQL